MDLVAHCLDDHELLALVEARLGLAARAAALGHLDLCHACLQLVAALTAARTRADRTFFATSSRGPG